MECLTLIPDLDLFPLDFKFVTGNSVMDPEIFILDPDSYFRIHDYGSRSRKQK